MGEGFCYGKARRPDIVAGRTRKLRGAADAGGRKPEPGGWNRLVIEVEDLAVLVERLKADGGKFRNEIVTGPGGKQILVEDPSGNVVELFQAAE